MKILPLSKPSRSAAGRHFLPGLFGFLRLLEPDFLKAVEGLLPGQKRGGVGLQCLFLFPLPDNPHGVQGESELKQQKQDLEAEKKSLLELAQRIQTERQELIQITQQVHRIQREIDQAIIRVRDDEGKNLAKLAKTYGGMSPDGAAIVMKGLDDVSLVKVLLFMKESETAPILELIARKSDVDAKRMALVSERLRLAQMSRTKPAPASP